MAVAQKTAAQRRAAVAAQYRKFIGRNHYSQALRNYCVKKYKDGKYYSDCSSSVSYAYKQAGEGFGILNTVGMWTSKKLKDVAVVIKNGIIQNPEVLEVGDMLLFAGNDTSRKAYGYVGHVEMVGAISGRPAPSTGVGSWVSGGSANELALSPAKVGRSNITVTLYGHGSGLAKQHEMNAYCRSRRNTKSSTPLGNRGLIRVRRAIWEDAGDGEPLPSAPSALPPSSEGTSSVTAGAVPPSPEGTSSVTAGAVPPSPEGEGMETADAMNGVPTGTTGGATGTGAADAMNGVPTGGEGNGGAVRITGASVNVRRGPGTSFGIVGVVHRDERLTRVGQRSGEGWYAVRYRDGVGWVSGKYARPAD